MGTFIDLEPESRRFAHGKVTDGGQEATRVGNLMGQRQTTNAALQLSEQYAEAV